VPVSGSRKQLRRTAARRVAVLALLLPAFTASAEPVDFRLLPALTSERAINGLLLEVARDGDRLLVAGEQGRILWSDDNGQNWTQASVPVSLAITSVTFAGNGDAWATAHDGYLLRSEDRGATWSIALSGSDVAALSVGAIEKQVEALRTALADAVPDLQEEAGWALDEALFALEEAQLAVEEGMTTPLLKVWFADADTGYALGAYNVFLHTDDGGVTWESLSYRLDNPNKYHFYGIARSSAGTLLLAGEAGTLLRSLDDGATWERVVTPYQGSFFGTVAPSDGSLLIFGLRGNVFRSTDEGASWIDVDTHDNRTLMCGTADADGTVVLAGAAGAVLHSSDAGISFRVVATEGNRVYSGVITNRDGSIMLVGFGGISVLTAEASND
jgi:photosystem II stability/assembly factor-like uncharacterized protein